MTFFDPGFLNPDMLAGIARSFATLTNNGTPTAGGGFPASPTGGFLDSLGSTLPGGLLGHFGNGGQPGEAPQNALTTASTPVTQLAATVSPLLPGGSSASMPQGGGWWSDYGVGALPGASPRFSFPTTPTPTQQPAASPLLPMPQSATPQDQGGGLLGALGEWLGNNRSALMGFGAGIAGGSNWGEGINKGWQNAMAGSAHDQKRVAENQTAAALTNRGFDADTAQAAARNPAMLRAIMGQGFRPQARPPSLQSNVWPGPPVYGR